MAEIKTAGARLRKLRLDAGLTQESLAQLIGRSARSVSNWEADRHRIPGSVTPLLARTLGVGVDRVTPLLARTLGVGVDRVTPLLARTLGVGVDRVTPLLARTLGVGVDRVTR